MGKHKKSDTEKKDKKKAKASKKEAAVLESSTIPGGIAKVEKPSKKSAAAPKAKKAVKSITTEDIALRAYFIAERRHKMGWHGDHDGDWAEAERQLREEAKKAV